MSSNRAELARDLATTTMSCPCFMRSSERRYASLILRRTLFRTWALPILVLTVMPSRISPFLPQGAGQPVICRGCIAGETCNLNKGRQYFSFTYLFLLNNFFIDQKTHSEKMRLYLKSKDQCVRRALPFARRLARTFLPFLVLILFIKPCSLLR